jgi:hypothetical protein
MSKLTKAVIAQVIVSIALCGLWVYGIKRVTETSSTIALFVIFILCGACNGLWFAKYVKKLKATENEAI